MGHDVFISYSRKDKIVVDFICKELNRNSISYWIDKDVIRMGDTFSEKIVSAIKESKVTVFISSNDSNLSHYTIKEITIAFKNNKHIIPFRIEDVPFADSLEFYLCDLNWVDAFPDYYIHIEKLITDIKRLIRRDDDSFVEPNTNIRNDRSVDLNHLDVPTSKLGKFFYKIFIDKQ